MWCQAAHITTRKRGQSSTYFRQISVAGLAFDGHSEPTFGSVLEKMGFGDLPLICQGSSSNILSLYTRVSLNNEL